MILILKHIDIEGPGTLGDFLIRKGYELKIVDLGQGQKLPNSLLGVEAVVCLGGPMNVYEEDKYSFLADENQFIKKVLNCEVPFLGICLGSQLLSKACEAKVGKSPVKEIGFSKVQITEEGKRDLLFDGIDLNFDVYQWHEDMFGIPEGAKLLVTGKDCPHQALKVGSCAYGLQFHVEVTDVSIKEWAEEYFGNSDPVLRKKKEDMLSDYYRLKNQFHAAGEKIYNNFHSIIVSKKALV